MNDWNAIGGICGGMFIYDGMFIYLYICIIYLNINSIHKCLFCAF